MVIDFLHIDLILMIYSSWLLERGITPRKLKRESAGRQSDARANKTDQLGGIECANEN